MIKNAETLRLVEGNLCAALRDDPASRVVRFKRHETIYRQGESSSLFYAVVSGRVLVNMVRPDGFELMLEIMGAGVLMGEAAAFDGRARFSSAVALEDVEAIEFQAGDLPAAFQRNPSLAMSFLTVTAYKQRVLANRLLALTMASPQARIAEVLLRLCTFYGEACEEGTLISTRLSHEQMAALVGTTRVTVTRALKDMVAEKILRVNDSSITILDMKRLSEVCGL